MWTAEQRKAASDRATIRWADPAFKESQKKAKATPPKCPVCGETDITKFYVDKNGRRTNKKCRECHKKACADRWHSRSWVDRWSSRGYKYGVTKEFLIELYDRQDGKCAICGKTPGTKRGLHIDHDHDSGKVRGLLCHHCNIALGSFNNVFLLQNATIYLEGAG